MKLLWISDFFLKDNVHGGAELVDDIVIRHISKSHDLTLINSHEVKEEVLDKFDKIIVSNFVNLSASTKSNIQDRSYIIFEHDHKYLINRDPSAFRYHQAPPRYIVNKEFYKNAEVILCQSRGHSLCLKKNLYIDNVVNLGASMWTEQQYNVLESLSSTDKNDLCAVMDSPNPVKNTNLAVRYCQKNNISYDLIPGSSWELFVKKLSKYKKLVFFPNVYESHCRLVVEARMMNLELITNNNIGATSEPWFAELKGRELISHMRSAKEKSLKKFEEVIVQKNNHPAIEKPLVSIITSMFKGESHVENFLENIVNQTYFKNCELILLNANSPENEDEIVKPYLEKYENIYYERLKDDPGIYGTWNLALQKSSGKYITNANLDDRRSLNQIEELVKALEFNPQHSLAYTECYVTEKDGEDFYTNSSNNTVYPAADFSRENMIKCLPGCMPLWKREIHEKYGMFNENYKMAGDWEMWLRAVKNGCTFIRIDEPLGLYYFNPNGLSTNTESSRAKERYEEEKDVFWRYVEVFGKDNAELYREYFSR